MCSDVFVYNVETFVDFYSYGDLRSEDSNGNNLFESEADEQLCAKLLESVASTFSSPDTKDTEYASEISTEDCLDTAVDSYLYQVATDSALDLAKFLDFTSQFQNVAAMCNLTAAPTATPSAPTSAPTLIPTVLNISSGLAASMTLLVALLYIGIFYISLQAKCPRVPATFEKAKSTRCSRLHKGLPILIYK